MGTKELDVLIKILSKLDEISAKLDEVNSNLWSITGETREQCGYSIKEVHERIGECTTTLMEHITAVADNH